MTLPELTKLIEEGGIAVTAGLAVLAWIWERRTNKALTQQLLQLAMSQVEAQTAGQALQKDLKETVVQAVQRGK